MTSQFDIAAISLELEMHLKLVPVELHTFTLPYLSSAFPL